MFVEKELRAAMILADVSMDDLASAIGIHRSTLYRKIDNGGKFTREEISKILDVCHIDDPKPIFFA